MGNTADRPSYSVLLSIVIPTWNREEMVMEAIDSLVKQDYQDDLEIIVVDDGSTDNTVLRIKKYCQSIPINRKILLIQSEHGGITRAVRQGILVAQGKYYAGLGSDDQWESTRARQLIMAEEQFGGRAMIFTNWKIINSEGRVLSEDGIRYRGFTPVDYYYQKTDLLSFYSSFWIPGGTFIIPRQFLLGDFLIPEGLVSEDYWFGLSAILQGDVRYLNTKDLTVRYHSGQYSFNTMTGFNNDLLLDEVVETSVVSSLIKRQAPKESRLLRYLSIKTKLLSARSLSQRSRLQAVLRTLSSFPSSLLHAHLLRFCISNLIFIILPKLHRSMKLSLMPRHHI